MLILNERTHENLGHKDESLWGGLVTVIKYNGCLLERCQAEAWSKTMASLWTARQSGSAGWTELLSPSAALIQALFNTGQHPNYDQHQPSDKPAHCALHQNHKHKLWKEWLTLAWRASLCITQYGNDENVCLLRFPVRGPFSACRTATVTNIDPKYLQFHQQKAKQTDSDTVWLEEKLWLNFEIISTRTKKNSDFPLEEEEKRTVLTRCHHVHLESRTGLELRRQSRHVVRPVPAAGLTLRVIEGTARQIRPMTFLKTKPFFKKRTSFYSLSWTDKYYNRSLCVCVCLLSTSVLIYSPICLNSLMRHGALELGAESTGWFN